MRADGSLDARSVSELRAAGARTRPGTRARRPSTTPRRIAVPAILTGQRPKPGTLPSLADHPDNLFTLLGKRYTIRASEQVTRLCPSRYCPRTRRGAGPRPSARPVLRRVRRVPPSRPARVPPRRAAADRRAVGRVRRELPRRHPRAGARRAWTPMRGCSAVLQARGQTREQFAHSSAPSAGPPPASAPSSSSTRCCRTVPRISCRPAGSTARSTTRDALRDEQDRWLGRRCSSTRRSSTTCCRSDTPTRSSGRSCVG